MQLDLVTTALWLCAAATAAAVRLRRRATGAVAAAVAAALLASLHAFHWNRPIYFAGRRWLMDRGVYADRLWLKLALGAAALAIALLIARRSRAWLARVEPLLRVAGAAMALDLGYIAARTLSIDGWMPMLIAVEPGKSALGIALAAVGWLALSCSRPRTPDHPANGKDRALFLD